MQSVDHKENILELTDVTFSYNKELVIDRVNLNLHRGDYLALTGKNGAGKTTLIKLILGLLPASYGTIKWFGEKINAFKGWSMLGYVPQKATSFDVNFPATVEEVVIMGRYGLRGLFNQITHVDRQKAREAMEIMGVLQHSKKLVGSLSGGEQQRVFIARAIAGEPKVLILDEPTISVEAKIKKEFYELLNRLNRDMGLTILLITHDIENITDEVMHVACLDKSIYFHDKVDSDFVQSHKATHKKI